MGRAAGCIEGNSGHVKGVVRARMLKSTVLLSNSRKFGTCRSFVIQALPLSVCFQWVACGLWIALPVMSLAGMPAMLSIATTTDDIEN
jgi:hypothetical protein